MSTVCWQFVVSVWLNNFEASTFSFISQVFNGCEAGIRSITHPLTIFDDVKLAECLTESPFGIPGYQDTGHTEICRALVKSTS